MPLWIATGGTQLSDGEHGCVLAPEMTLGRGSDESGCRGMRRGR